MVLEASRLHGFTARNEAGVSSSVETKPASSRQPELLYGARLRPSPKFLALGRARLIPTPRSLHAILPLPGVPALRLIKLGWQSPSFTQDKGQVLLREPPPPFLSLGLNLGN